MPTGIILSSASQGATKEAVEKVLAANGFEVEAPAAATTTTDSAAAAAAETPAAPKREDFASDEEFEIAHEAFQVEQDEAREKAELEAEENEEDGEATAAAAAAPRQKLTRRQRAIDKATRELRDELRAYKERLAALEGKGGKQTTEPAAPKLEVPKREDFQTDAEFDEAMFDYRYKVRRAKEEKESARTEQQTRLQEHYENYRAGVAEFKATHDDWDEVVNQKIPMHESAQLTILELENGPAVTYYLGKYPAFTQELAKMSPLAAVVEIGRLSDKLKKAGAREPRGTDGAAKTKTRPRLPEPVRPVSTAATASTLSSAEAAKNRDFRAFKAAQRAGR